MKQMKKLSLVLMAVICLFTACNKQKPTAESNEIQVSEYKIFRDVHSDKICTVSVSVEFPVSGEKQYLDSVRLWIDTVLCFNPFTQDNNMPAFNGKKDDAQALVSYYSLQKMKSASENNDSQAILSDGVMFENADSIFVSFKNKYLTSLSCMNYCFLGGAHGGTIVRSQTFSNKTGKTYGWDMIKDKDKLFDYINEGLMEYFEVSTAQEMKEMLILEQPSVPLPQQCPYFTSDGLILQYQQYEIAPYSAGLPYVLIPWDKCKDILIPEITQMLPLTADK